MTVAPKTVSPSEVTIVPLMLPVCAKSEKHESSSVESSGRNLNMLLKVLFMLWLFFCIFARKGEWLLMLRQVLFTLIYYLYYIVLSP